MPKPYIFSTIDVVHHNDLQLDIDRKAVERLIALEKSGQVLADIRSKLREGVVLPTFIQTIGRPDMMNLDTIFGRLKLALDKHQTDQIPINLHSSGLTNLVSHVDH